MRVSVVPRTSKRWRNWSRAPKVHSRLWEPHYFVPSSMPTAPRAPWSAVSPLTVYFYSYHWLNKNVNIHLWREKLMEVWHMIAVAQPALPSYLKKTLPLSQKLAQCCPLQSGFPGPVREMAMPLKPYWMEEQRKNRAACHRSTCLTFTPGKTLSQILQGKH